MTSWANLPTFLARGQMDENYVASGSGVTTEVRINSLTITCTSPRRYRVWGDVGNIWGSATNGQAVLRLRYVAGTSAPTTSSTSVGHDKHIYGFTTQSITGTGGFVVASVVPAASGQYTFGLFLLQGNTNASLSYNDAQVFIDDIRGT